MSAEIIMVIVTLSLFGGAWLFITSHVFYPYDGTFTRWRRGRFCERRILHHWEDFYMRGRPPESKKQGWRRCAKCGRVDKRDRVLKMRFRDGDIFRSAVYEPDWVEQPQKIFRTRT